MAKGHKITTPIGFIYNNVKNYSNKCTQRTVHVLRSFLSYFGRKKVVFRFVLSNALHNHDELQA